MDKGTLASNFSRAKMGKKAIVIVEAEPDKLIYMNLARRFSLNITVRYVGEFEDTDLKASNCEYVIEAIKKLQSKFEQDGNNLKYALGIIDRDVRYYKDITDWLRVNSLVGKGLHILKHYSIETYFATPHNLRELIWLAIKHHKIDELENIIAETAQKIVGKKEALYYVALDSLKEHCLGQDVYKAFKNIGTKKIKEVIGSIPHFETSLLPNKKEDLDKFALSKGILITDEKCLINGKWYLFYYVKHLYEVVGNDNFTNNTTIEALYDYIKRFFDKNEFEDILEALKKLN